MKPVFVIKIKPAGTREFRFLASGGKVNRLKVHALRFYDRAHVYAVMNDAAAKHPEHEWKVEEWK